MSRVITFSRVFPSYHEKAGEPTYFVEQLYNSLFSKNNLMDYPEGIEINDHITGVKKHTIRNGNRWKVGDKFSPRVWSGTPYKTKQIILCNDVEIKKIFDIEINKGVLCIDGKMHTDISELAQNDGLTEIELLGWFKYPKDFKGQIICWNESVEYYEKPYKNLFRLFRLHSSRFCSL